MTATHQRTAVFNELQTLVSEYDNAFAAQNTDARWNVDDALSGIIIRLNGETRRVRRLQTSKQTAAA